MTFKKGDSTCTSTLCWDCDRSILECSWLHIDKPVDGWTAIPTKLRVQTKKQEAHFIDSFKVEKCPLFIPVDSERKKDDQTGWTSTLRTLFD